MKYVFLIAFLVLLAMTGVAWYLTPSDVVDGRKVIVWATDDNPRRRAQVDLFNQLHPEYQLRIDATNNGLDKVITQSLAGVGPDVFDSYQDRISLLEEAGLLQDVTGELAKRGITLDKTWPLARPGISVDGRIYGMACNVGGNAIWYHKDIFAQAGLACPPTSNWKWEDFVNTAQKLTLRDENGRIVRYGLMGLAWYDVALINEARLLTPDGRKCVVDSPECIDAIQKWVDLQLKYKVMPSRFDEQTMGTQGGWGSGAITLFKDKRVAMACGGRWWLCLIRDCKDENGKFPLDLGVAEKPILKIRRFAGGARVAFVNALSPRRDRAIEFLDFLMSNEYADCINRDADALPAPIAAATRPAYSYDAHEGHDGGGSPVWRDQMAYSVTGELSPYITGQEINNAIDLQIDLAIMGRKSVADAMRQAAKDVNAQIAYNISRNPQLKKRYENGDTSPVLGNFADLPTAATTREQR